MNNMKLVSLIVPIYNVAPYLRKCLDSLVAQSYPSIEIIAVDDGSKDESGEIAEEYAQRYSYVHVIHKENGGLSSARNAGLKVAKGDYIAFIDSDDCVSLDYVELMVSAIEQGYDYAECHNIAFDEDGKQWEYEYQSTSEISQMDFIENPNLLVNVAMFVRGNMYRRELLGDLLFPEGLVHEDIYYTSILFHDVLKICKVDGAVYYYMIRNNSIANHASIKMFDMYEIMKRVYAYYEERDWRITKLLEKTYVRSFLIAIMFRKSAHLPKEHFAQREDMRHQAIATLHKYAPFWWLNSLITPKEKIAVFLLHFSWVMRLVWKGESCHG